MAKAFLDRVSNKAIGQLLIERGFLSTEQCDEALAHSRREGVRLGEALVALGYVSRDVLSYALGEQYGLQPVELDPSMVDLSLVRRFPLEFLRHHLMLPLIEIGDEIIVVVSDPNDAHGLREFAGFVPAQQVSAQLADPDQVRRCLEVIESTSRHWSTADPTPVPTDCDLEAVEARPSEGTFVRWLVTAAVQHPEADLLVSCSGSRASVLRRRKGGEGETEIIHEFDGALFGSLRETILAQCDPISPATAQVAMFSSQLRFAGRVYALQIAFLRHVSGEILRLRPLSYPGDPSASPVPAVSGNGHDNSPGHAVQVLLYDSRRDLETYLEELFIRGGAHGLPLLLQETTRRIFPAAAAYPGLFVDAPQVALATGAALVVFDYPVTADAVLRIRGAEQRAPAVVVCAPVGAGLSPDVAGILRSLNPAVVHLGASDRAATLTAVAALEQFGGNA